MSGLYIARLYVFFHLLIQIILEPLQMSFPKRLCLPFLPSFYFFFITFFLSSLHVPKARHFLFLIIFSFRLPLDVVNAFRIPAAFSPLPGLILYKFFYYHNLACVNPKCVFVVIGVVCKSISFTINTFINNFFETKNCWSYRKIIKIR